MESEVVMEWVLLGTIVTIIIVGCWLARSTQDYIDEQNERIRQSEYNKRQQMYGDKNAK
jgi:hypothetical protein|tara:strand:+ start:330 stop:506 length:177 start_codon:yes stop_codon:yes gene_type:complete